MSTEEIARLRMSQHRDLVALGGKDLVEDAHAARILRPRPVDHSHTRGSTFTAVQIAVTAAVACSSAQRTTSSTGGSTSRRSIARASEPATLVSVPTTLSPTTTSAPAGGVAPS